MTTSAQAMALLDVALAYFRAQRELAVANAAYTAACENANKITYVHDGTALALRADPALHGDRSIFEPELYDLVRDAAGKAASATFALHSAASAYGECALGWQTKPEGVETLTADTITLAQINALHDDLTKHESAGVIVWGVRECIIAMGLDDDALDNDAEDRRARARATCAEILNQRAAHAKESR